jgi:biotin carboxylase
MRILLVASTTGYQVREFSAAAEELGYELALATDRCHVLPDPWADHAAPIDFRDPDPWIAALPGPYDGIVAVGDRPAQIAARIAQRFGLRFHPPDAAEAASNKLLARERFRAAGLPTPCFQCVELGGADGGGVRYPCVLKPLDGSGSRGVMRADNPRQFRVAVERMAGMLDGVSGVALVEDYIPGREFALEGVVTGGRLAPLALFDKPDPLEGPYFEETIYVTPSREPAAVQAAMVETAQRAVRALGLTDGPVHAEMRVNQQGVWMLEAAARPIGGLCARVLRFVTGAGRTVSLETLLLQHAAGLDIGAARLAPGAHGVMMLPIPRGGVFQGVAGLEEARRTAGVEDIVITAREGQNLAPLPEGASYLGFAFARGANAATAEHALRSAHARLDFRFAGALPIIKHKRGGL